MNYYIHPAIDVSVKDYVVLSSGLGGHANFWNPQIDVLKQHFNVLTYDQEGCHADAELLDDNYSMTNMAQQVFEILNQEKIEQCHFIGHALGGHIGAELAVLINKHNQVSREKKKILSLTSINAWDTLDPHTEKCFTARIALLEHAGAAAYVQAQALFLYPPAWISQNIANIEKAEEIQLSHFPPVQNVFSRLKALKQFKINQQHVEALQNTKIHLIANQDDFLVPYRKTSDLHTALGHGTCSIFEKGAHASTVTEHEMINQAIMDFLLN